MPRTPEQNAQVREDRKKQILDSALTIYIRFGFHGTDMDAVAREAGLAKGLLYYYFKTKRELFIALYETMLVQGTAFSDALMENTEGLDPVEQLMAYAYGLFMESRKHLRVMQFFIRIPFDVHAIFGPAGWDAGARTSSLHASALAAVISRGIEQGLIPPANARGSANSFWSVFVANAFSYERMLSGKQEVTAHTTDAFREIVRFCFQGLGIESRKWNACLEAVTAAKRKEEPQQ
jgi:AcrR family transcriptional regulator